MRKTKTTRKTKPGKKAIRTHLETLTKSEIIDFIITLAPESFIETIRTRFATREEAEKKFKTVAAAISAMFKNEKLLYDINGFEDKLLGHLESLRGLWDNMYREIGELIITLARDIDQASEEGYLYVIHYDRSDEYFESKMTSLYVAEFIRSLPKEYKKTYKEKLLEVSNEMGFISFLNDLR